MTATTATDESGVEYYFDCTAGGGNDSGWQDGISYEDTGLMCETSYSYRVQARDKSPNQNTTGWSSTQSATTGACGGGPADGRYQLSPKGGTTQMDVTSSDPGDGVNIQVYRASSHDNQKFDVTHVGGGYYKVLAVHSGKAVEVADSSTADGANVQQWTYTGADNQLFEITNEGGGYYALRAKHSGKVVAATGTKSRSNVEQVTFTGADLQLWLFSTTQ